MRFLIVARYLFYSLIFILPLCALAQDSAYITGKILTSSGIPAQGIGVSEKMADKVYSVTNESGKYSLTVKALQSTILLIKDLFSGEILHQQLIPSIPPGQVYIYNYTLTDFGRTLKNYTVHDNAGRREFLTLVDPQLYQRTINPGMNFEAILRMLGPVAMNNELTSQYNVRGGNFDENLVYVNDIEIYRPQLVRSGQQEGLSFINPLMVQNVKFSAGGFESRYGDKMSSVLDVQYRRLTLKDTAGSVNFNANLMGGLLTYQKLSANRKFSILTGTRFRSNGYLLSSLDQQGNYKPIFGDIQALAKFQINSGHSLELLVSFGQNRYLFYPQSQTTSFGTVNNAMQVYIGFEGSELARYKTGVGALTYKYFDGGKWSFKSILSSYLSDESEASDVIGGYELRDLDNDLSSTNFGKVKTIRGTGAFMYHTRNKINIRVLTLKHLFVYNGKKLKWQGGLQAQQENISDRMHEWRLQDSAGYLIPLNSGGNLNLQDVVSSLNNLKSERYSGYIQCEYKWWKKYDFYIISGVRSQYWTINNQLTLSPRFQLSFKPFKSLHPDSSRGYQRNWLFRFAVGVYHQPPFYRELRRSDGTLNLSLKAQRSIHYIAGADMEFKAWDRPFKFVAEMYFKQYDSLIPYDMDNIRIRYKAVNMASGYASGVDIRINGEFVETLESWASVSFMKTSEKIMGYGHFRYYDDKGLIYLKPVAGLTTDSAYINWFPRPSDQRINFNIFFQDHLPKYPSYRMSMNLVYGSALPTSPMNARELRNAFRLSPYRRVDIGFSKILLKENHTYRRGIAKHLKSAWISLEIFNILQFNNSVSFIWVKDVTNREYAVPNYLTGRRINMSLQIKL